MMPQSKREKFRFREPNMADLTPTIEQIAQAPKSSAGETGSVEQQPIDDIIKADKYGKAERAKKKPLRGASFIKIVSPGA